MDIVLVFPFKKNMALSLVFLSESFPKKMNPYAHFPRPNYFSCSFVFNSLLIFRWRESLLVAGFFLTPTVFPELLLILESLRYSFPALKRCFFYFLRIPKKGIKKEMLSLLEDGLVLLLDDERKRCD